SAELRPFAPVSFDNGCARPRPAADGIGDRALDDAREATDRRQIVALAMHHKGPVKLPPIDQTYVHSSRVSFHEHRSQRHRLSSQSASNEIQTKPWILGLEWDVGSKAPFPDRAIHDAAHRIRTAGKSEWKLHDILNPHRIMRRRQVGASHQDE